ncbi:MAG: hypothetical protein KGL39_06285 [Patescibacteria group bacterium]|nr:hypothetical protein [Patescibacteria group bacterium]
MCRRPLDSVAECVDFIMAKSLKDLTREEALRKEAEVLERLAEIYRALGRGEDVVLPALGAPEASQGETSDNPLAKLPLIDAIMLYLLQADGPKKPAQICKALIAAGRDFDVDNPLTSVGSALRKTSLRDSDLAYAGSGGWTLKSKYRTADFNRLFKKRSGRGGKSTAEHAQRTKEGMIAKGIKFGRKPKFGPDDIAKFRDLVENQNVRPMAALKEVGISTPYYYEYKDAIYAWQPGEPWPPPKGVSGDQLRAMGIIPMHARVVGEDK